MDDIPDFSDLINDDEFRFDEDIDMNRIQKLNRAVTELFIKDGDNITPAHGQIKFTPEQRDILVERIRKYIQNFNIRELSYFIFIGKVSFIQRCAIYIDAINKATGGGDIDDDPVDEWPEG